MQTSALQSLTMLLDEPEALKPTFRNIAGRLLHNAIAEAVGNATTLPLFSDHGRDVWLAVVRGKSRRAIDRERKARNSYHSTGCGADCTGRVFQKSADLLRAWHDRESGEWVGVLVCAQYRDI